MRAAPASIRRRAEASMCEPARAEAGARARERLWAYGTARAGGHRDGRSNMRSRQSGPAAPGRRVFLGGAAAVGAAAVLPVRPGAVKSAPDDRHRGGFRVSLSVSPVTESVLGSLSLTDGGRTAGTVAHVQRLFGRHGATEVFVRVATLAHARSGDAEYGFARAIERARLARQLGMPLNPELGLWDVYGDIRRQPPPDFSDYPSIRLPGPWTTLTLGQMERALRQHMWPYVGRLLAAAAQGVRGVDQAARFSTHLASIAVQDATFPVAFWEAMNRAGYHPGQFGTSLYPTNGDPGDRAAVFLTIARTLQRRFGRQLFVAEFGYPSGQMGPPFAWNTTQAGYPQTPDGQFRYLRDLVAASVASQAVGGIRPWGPDYCLAAGGWAPMSLFTEDGRAKPGLAAIQEGLRSSRTVHAGTGPSIPKNMRNNAR